MSFFQPFDYYFLIDEIKDERKIELEKNESKKEKLAKPKKNL